MLGSNIVKYKSVIFVYFVFKYVYIFLKKKKEFDFMWFYREKKRVKWFFGNFINCSWKFIVYLI